MIWGQTGPVFQGVWEAWWVGYEDMVGVGYREAMKGSRRGYPTHLQAPS